MVSDTSLRRIIRSPFSLRLISVCLLTVCRETSGTGGVAHASCSCRSSSAFADDGAMKVASMTAEIIGNEQIILLAKPDICGLLLPGSAPGAAFFRQKKAGAPIPLRYFGDPAVSERPNRLSVPPLRMV